MNYEFKGTPGPWRLATISDNQFLGHTADGKPYTGVIGGLGHYDHNGRGFNITAIMSEEDAHLIAAAPCLLQAAIRLISLSENDGGHLKSGNGSHYLNDLKLAIHKALNIQ